uniref:Uncharacterized protein n=1 Tax=Arundo donax TaxID=35708 RepID=A0A0A9BUJ2_ARUDO
MNSKSTVMNSASNSNQNSGLNSKL